MHLRALSDQTLPPPGLTLPTQISLPRTHHSTYQSLNLTFPEERHSNKHGAQAYQQGADRSWPVCTRLEAGFSSSAGTLCSCSYGTEHPANGDNTVTPPHHALQDPSVMTLYVYSSDRKCQKAESGCLLCLPYRSCVFVPTLTLYLLIVSLASNNNGTCM